MKIEDAPSSRMNWVVRRLRNAITSGELPADAPLRASHLAKEWDISPTPVREAFQRLAADGFVSHSSHQGVRVASISADELTELYSMRILIEPPAVARSVELGDDEWRAALTDAWQRLRAVADLEPFSRIAYEDAHRDWHHALVSASGSSWWPRTVNLLRDQCQRYWVLDLKPRPLEEVMGEHAEIQAACAGGDAAAAAALVRDHILRSEATVTAQLAQLDPSATGKS